MNEIHSYFIIYNLTHINSRKTAVGTNSVRPNYKGITRKNEKQKPPNTCIYLNY